MSFDLTQKIKIVNPHSNIDELYGVYNSVAEALTGVPLVLRQKGRTVGVLVGGSVVEYWFKDGVTDTDLVLKGGGEDSSNLTLEQARLNGNILAGNILGNTEFNKQGDRKAFAQLSDVYDNSYLEVSKSELDTLVTESKLQKGTLYKVSWVHTSFHDEDNNFEIGALYNDGEQNGGNGGVEIFLHVYPPKQTVSPTLYFFTLTFETLAVNPLLLPVILVADAQFPVSAINSISPLLAKVKSFPVAPLFDVMFSCACACPV